MSPLIVGVDLAARDENTAHCLLEAGAEGVRAREPAVGRELAEIEDAIAAADAVGIDAPFGWPEAAVEAIGAYTARGVWPEALEPRRLRYRRTDLAVHEAVLEARGVSLWPLSVSADRIAACAWRCAALLSGLAERTGWELDRRGPPGGSAGTGERVVVEVYPAGALAMWGLPHRGYKRGGPDSAAAARELRGSIFDVLARTAAGVELGAARSACLESDDALDALISALVALAAREGSTLGPDPGSEPRSRSEGWIHLPRADSLAALGVSAPAG